MNDNTKSLIRSICIVVGAIVCVGTAVALLVVFFKKHFKVTFECDGDCNDCNECTDYDDEEEAVEPAYDKDEEEADEKEDAEDGEQTDAE